MSNKRQKSKAKKKQKKFLDSLRLFLVPAIWKQGHQAHTRRHRRCSWDIQPLVLVLLSLTWATGHSQEERFETARGFCVSLLPKRRRPGQTHAGFLTVSPNAYQVGDLGCGSVDTPKRRYCQTKLAAPIKLGEYNRRRR